MSNPPRPDAPEARSADEIAEGIRDLLFSVHPDDRVGFLFGIVLGMLHFQGLTREEIHKEMLKGLELAYKASELLKSNNPSN